MQTPVLLPIRPRPSTRLRSGRLGWKRPQGTAVDPPAVGAGAFGVGEFQAMKDSRIGTGRMMLGGSLAATVAALALLMGSGVGYRMAASRLAQTHGSVRLPRGTLGALPLSLGTWRGRDVPLTAAVIGATDTDDHVNRAYGRESGRERVSLFLGYGVRVRDLMPHRPEVCYVGAGWVLDNKKQAELVCADGTLLPVTIHRFERGGLDSRRLSVLNYYIIDGRRYADVSALRAEAWRLRSDLSYIAQVQIAGTGVDLLESGEGACKLFAVDSAPAIRELLKRAVDEAVERL